MTDQNHATDWPAAWNALDAIDDIDSAAWNAESDRIDRLWKAEYKTAFVAFALSRPDWTREDAELWCYEIVEDAGVNTTPAEAAKADVLQCEREMWHG